MALLIRFSYQPLMEKLAMEISGTLILFEIKVADIFTK